MSALDRAYASNEQIIHETLEFSHSAIPSGKLYLVEDELDLTVTLEDSTEVTFTSAGFKAVAPSRTTEGRQDLNITISNLDSQVWNIFNSIEQANRITEERVLVNYRSFVPSDLSQPSGPIYKMVASELSLTREAAVITASFESLPDLKYPRKKYYTTEYPYLRYV